VSPFGRKLLGEGVGSLLLFATVVGSGIMAESLSSGDVALALLGNTLATGAILYVLITMLGPVSGAQFNPAVTLVMRLRGDCCWKGAAAVIAVQIGAGIVGVWLAHAMFDLPILQLSAKHRAGMGQWLGEFVATFGLLLTIIGTSRYKPEAVPTAVALFITAGYWFTSSTSFANPAITLARSLSDTFAGISLADVPGFIAAQLAGALTAHWTARVLFPDRG
jgi:glycerol uptake facilitator-like aquaporin